MAIVTPGADYRQFTGKNTTPLVYDIICAHTEVGTNEGSISIGAQAGHSFAHMYLAGTGYLAQCQDLAYRAAANLDGNWHIISWETEDMKGGVFPDTWTDPPWTQAQLDKLIQGMAWQCARFNIPPVLIPDTKPGRRGLAYHRQGIYGNFVPYDGIVQGGELWSKSSGKTCPASRVEQFKTIVVPEVARLLKPPVQEDDDMPTFYTSTNPAQPYLLVDATVSEVGSTETVINGGAAGFKTVKLHEADYNRKVEAANLALATSMSAAGIYTEILALNEVSAELAALSAQQLEELKKLTAADA